MDSPGVQYWHCPTLPEEEDEDVEDDEELLEEEHWPPVHGTDPGHTVPHAPQFTGSDWRSTQMPLHSVAAFDGHPHAPFWQVCGMGQALPHAPQLASSVAVMAQYPLQSVPPPTMEQLNELQ
jgi:hypothetical protein